MSKKFSISHGSVGSEDDDIKIKFMSRGASELTNAELLSIVIGEGDRQSSSIAVCRDLMRELDNNLLELSQLEFGRLRSIAGMGVARAAAVISALELGRRYRAAQTERRSTITSMRDVEDIFRPLLADLPHEEFWAVYLTSANKILHKVRISHGAVNSTSVDNKIIIKQAISRLASGIILVHNHPSGEATPSNPDIELTAKLKEAAAFFDIALTDHVIITANRCYSFRNENLL